MCKVYYIQIQLAVAPAFKDILRRQICLALHYVALYYQFIVYEFVIRVWTIIHSYISFHMQVFKVLYKPKNKKYTCLKCY